MPEKEQILPIQITFNEGKVNYLQFNYDNKTYHATIKDSQIEFRNSDGHATYDRTTKNMTMALRHICGAQGFGQSLDDCCPACAPSTRQSASFPAPEHYQKVDRYCQGLEELLKNNPLILDKSEEGLKRYELVEFLAQHGKTLVWSSCKY